MNKREKASWNELVAGAKAVKLDHVPVAEIEALFAGFVHNAKAEGLGTPKNSPQSSGVGLFWLLVGLVYLVVLIHLKH